MMMKDGEEIATLKMTLEDTEEAMVAEEEDMQDTRALEDMTTIHKDHSRLTKDQATMEENKDSSTKDLAIRVRITQEKAVKTGMETTTMEAAALEDITMTMILTAMEKIGD